EVGSREAAHRLAVPDHLHRHLDDDHLGAFHERLGRRRGGPEDQRGREHSESPPPKPGKHGLHESSIFDLQRFGPATDASHPLRYSPCGWVTATGWSGAAASGWRSATRTPASTAAAKKICRKSLVS